MRARGGVRRQQDARRADGQRHLVRGRTPGGGCRAVAGASRPPVVDQQIRGEAHPGRFSTTLRWPGVCVVPPGWDPDYGVGRVDLLALLKAPLPGPQDLVEVGAFGASDDDAVARIAAMISADPVRVRIRLAELLKVSTTTSSTGPSPNTRANWSTSSSPIGSLQSPWHNPRRSVPFLPRSALPVSPATWASG